MKASSLALIGLLALSCTKTRTQPREPQAGAETPSAAPASGVGPAQGSGVGPAQGSASTPGGSRDPTLSASGGVIDGNGGEVIQTEHNPWFVGTAAVPYCVDRKSDFSVDKAQAAEVVRAVLTAWADVQRQVGQDVGGSSQAAVDATGPVSNLGVATGFQEVDCAAAPPLQFRLGGHDSDVDAVLHYTAKLTVGFAQRTAYDERTGRSRGYIWLAPDLGAQRYAGPAIVPAFWSHSQVLRTVLFHEVGHIFGWPHMVHTMMAAEAPGQAVKQGFAVPWSGQEFILSRGSLNGAFCGRQLADARQPDVIKKIWGVTAVDPEFCLQPRHDLRATEDENTPNLLEIKNEGAVVASQIIRSKGLNSDTVESSGHYLVAGPDGPRYQKQIFAYMDVRSLKRGEVDLPGGLKQGVEIEMFEPGVFILRLATTTGWVDLPLIPPAFIGAQFALETLLRTDE